MKVKNFMKKFSALVLGLGLTLGVVSAVDSNSAHEVDATDKTVSIAHTDTDVSGKGKSGGGSGFSVTRDDITFTFSNAYGASSEIKVYANSNLVISGSSVTIKEVVITAGTLKTWTVKDNIGSLSASKSPATWKGSVENTIQLNMTSTAQAKVQKVSVTYSIAGTPEDHEHDFSEAKYNDSEHWMECDCGEKNDATPHTISFTKVDDSTHKKSCSGCAYQVVENHNWDNGVVSIPQVGTADGEMLYTCTDCGATKTSPIKYAKPESQDLYGTYKLCTSASDLEENAHYVLGGIYTKDNIDTYYFASAKVNTNNRPAIVQNVENNVVTLEENTTDGDKNVLVLTLVSVGTNYSFKVKNYNETSTSDKYLYASETNDKNYLLVKDNNSASNAKFNITFSDNGDVSIIATGGTRTDVRFNYNNGSPIISCYGVGGQLPIKLFKQVENKPITSLEIDTKHGTTTNFYESEEWAPTVQYNSDATIKASELVIVSGDAVELSDDKQSVVAVKEGTAVIKAHATDVTASTVYSNECTITVTKNSVTGITIKENPTNTKYSEGGYFDPAGLVITATKNVGSVDITYSESNKTEFSFVPSLETALTSEITMVNVTYSEKSTSFEITVDSKPHTTGLVMKRGNESIVDNSLEVTLDETLELTAIITPSNSEDAISWETSKDSVATVSEGVVTLIKTGNVTITATSNGISDYVDLTITDPSDSKLTAFEITNSDKLISDYYLDDNDVLDADSIKIKGTYTSELVPDWSKTVNSMSHEDFTFTLNKQNGRVYVSYVDENVASHYYNVTMHNENRPSQVEIDFSIASYEPNPTDDLIEWHSVAANIKNEKGTGTKVTNYIPTTYDKTRLYSGNTFTISPNSGYKITSIVITVSESADTFKSNWTNSKEITTSAMIVTIIPEKGTDDLTLKPAARCSLTKIVINYVEASFNVTFETDGSIIPETQVIKSGEKVVEPELTRIGYNFLGWAVKDSYPEKIWNFDTDLVEDDITLVAKWEKQENFVDVTEVTETWSTETPAAHENIQVQDAAAKVSFSSAIKDEAGNPVVTKDSNFIIEADPGKTIAKANIFTSNENETVPTMYYSTNRGTTWNKYVEPKTLKRSVISKEVSLPAGTNAVRYEFTEQTSIVGIKLTTADVKQLQGMLDISYDYSYESTTNEILSVSNVRMRFYVSMDENRYVSEYGKTGYKYGFLVAYESHDYSDAVGMTVAEYKAKHTGLASVSTADMPCYIENEEKIYELGLNLRAVDVNSVYSVVMFVENEQGKIVEASSVMETSLGDLVIDLMTEELVPEMALSALDQSVLNFIYENGI